MDIYPMAFDYEFPVYDVGFSVVVLVSGTCLIENSGDFWSIFGVMPGAVAGDGASIVEAFHNFLSEIERNALVIASESDGEKDFLDSLEGFCLCINKKNAELWSSLSVGKVGFQVHLKEA